MLLQVGYEPLGCLTKSQPENGGVMMSNSPLENNSGTDAGSDLQWDEFAALTAHVLGNRRQLKQKLEGLQVCLEDLRLVCKYQAFDLEATRRENEDLKALLELDD